MATFPGGGTTQKFRFIDQCESRYSIRALCRQMGVSASGFYAWKLRGPSARALQDAQLLASIRATFDQHQGRYGSPKIHQVLRRQSIFTARKRVARLMRDAGLKARVERVYRRVMTH